jgi:hypothetical protein
MLLRRRRPEDVPMAGLLVAAILYTLSYFFVSIACQYRYLYMLDLAAIAAALYLASDFPARFGKSEHQAWPANQEDALLRRA